MRHNKLVSRVLEHRAAEKAVEAADARRARVTLAGAKMAKRLGTVLEHTTEHYERIANADDAELQAMGGTEELKRLNDLVEGIKQVQQPAPFENVQGPEGPTEQSS